MTPRDRRARKQVMDTIVQTWPSINTTYQHLDPVTVSHPRAKRAAWHIPSSSRACRLRSTPHPLNGWGDWPRPCSLSLSNPPYYPSPGPLFSRCWQVAPYLASVYEGFLLITKGEMVLILINTIKWNSLENPPNESPPPLIGAGEKRGGGGERRGEEGRWRGGGGEDTDDLLGDRRRLEGWHFIVSLPMKGRKGRDQSI